MTINQNKTALDAEQFAGLFERYKNLVYKTAYLMLGNPAEAEEALQEVFVLVYRSYADYDPDRGAFSTWLHRITINYCLGMHRKAHLTVEDIEDNAPEPASESMEDGLSRLSEKQAVQLALKKLSEKQRAVIILRYYHDLAYADIAQVLKIPLGTVKSRIDLALRTLRQKLSREDKELNRIPLAKDEVAHEL